MSTTDSTNAAGTPFAPAVPKRFDSLDIEFHGIAIELATNVSGNLLDVATTVVGEVLGENWSVERTDEIREFFATHSSKTPPDFKIRQYWEFCVSLEARREITFARPDFDMPCFTDWPVITQSLGGSLTLKVDDNEYEDSRTDDKEWALKQCKVPEAWQLIRNAGKLPGEGIVIGHPDSGYREHTEMDSDRIHPDKWDFVRHDNDPATGHGRHGLGTASVIMSGEGGVLKGPALHSKIVPLRVTKKGLVSEVVLFPFFNYRRLRRSLVYSQDRNYDVISISLGTYSWSWRKKVHTRIRKLNRQGAIVVAAAGNKARIGSTSLFGDRTTYPGRWHETIGVAASTFERTTWKGSCRGNSVDISAPGDSVWRADYTSNSWLSGRPTTRRSAGTSFSTALVAGIAALWKSYRATELAQVDQRKVYLIFKQLLRSTAQTDHQLASRTGAGIIDAHALLNADIPENVDPPSTSSGHSPRIEISSKIKSMAPFLGSLAPISNRSLTGLNDRELSELDAAVDLELLYAVVNRGASRLSIVEELSPSLSGKLS